jgi:hypothetical protein
MTPDISTVWARIRAHAGEDFRLIRGDLFSYEISESYLRPVGRARELSRANFGKALSRVPLEGYHSVKDLQGPSYVFAILMDARVRSDDW